MEWVVTCECGWTYRGPENDLVTAVQQHGSDVHGIEVTKEQALAQATPA